MNNAINEIKSTLEGTNSRITEAEDRIWNILFLFLSIETLQARRDWQDILKVMKEKNLQPRLLYPARISSNMKRNQKLYRQAKAERIQHHQTSSSTNAK